MDESILSQHFCAMICASVLCYVKIPFHNRQSFYCATFSMIECIIKHKKTTKI